MFLLEQFLHVNICILIYQLVAYEVIETSDELSSKDFSKFIYFLLYKTMSKV